MLRLFILSLVFINAFSLSAQDTAKVWTKGGTWSATVSQVGLKNWVGGGQPSLSLNAFQSLYINMSRPKVKWTNQLDAGFGLLRQGRDAAFYKTDDKLILLSKVSRKLVKEWYASGLLDFRTQMAPGHEYTDLSKRYISNFMAPGYLLTSIGFEYKTDNVFYFMASPLTAKFTFVLDDTLSAQGKFGVKPGKKMRTEYGAYINTGVIKKLMDNITLNTRLGLFSNYSTFGNIDVNWELLLVMKVNKYISASLSTQLVYDDDIDVTRENGTVGPDIQFKEVINVGFMYQLKK